jgi:hypothetical protein
MRSDFFPRLAEFPSLLALADGTGSYHLAQPEPMEFSQIIRQPAQAAGLKFGFIRKRNKVWMKHCADAASTDPQVLPLLEFALEELYKRQSTRGDGLLRWEDFVSFGRNRGVIAAKADEAVAAAGPGGEQALGSFFPRWSDSELIAAKPQCRSAGVPHRRSRFFTGAEGWSRPCFQRDCLFRIQTPWDDKQFPSHMKLF